jgi:hypothetical protein
MNFAYALEKAMLEVEDIAANCKHILACLAETLFRPWTSRCAMAGFMRSKGVEATVLTSAHHSHSPWQSHAQG